MIDFGAVFRISAAALVAGAAAAATNVPLVNPGFESPYAAVSGNNGLIGGMIASGWTDNSSWSDSTVQYAQEFTNPHSGASCQKMAVAAVPNGEAQFQQTIPVVAGSLYTASVWMRSSTGAQVTVRIQDAAAPYESYVD